MEDFTIMELYINSNKIENVTEDPDFKQITEAFDTKLEELSKNSKTWRLWVLYFRMVSILKDSIYDDRTGNWKLHLQSIELMIPFFHVCGHYPYAKAATLYVQDMNDLENCMDPEEYKKFTTLGYWTVRRSDGFWKGIPSDQTIEQTLMKAMSIQGGGAFSRGATKSVVFQWIMGTLPVTDITERLKKRCGLVLNKSQQYKDSTRAGMNENEKFVLKFNKYIDSHNPLTYNELASISTGLVADKKINCIESFQLGIKVMDKIHDSETNFRYIKCSKADKVLTLLHMNSIIKIQDNEISVDPNGIFKRILTMEMPKDEFKEIFQYEISPIPQSLFDVYGMRKNTKSNIYDFVNPVNDNLKDNDIFAYIIDGGMLLHKIPWDLNDKFSLILERYVRYLRRLYGQSICVVFDGYEELSIKSYERSRRSAK